MTFSVTATQAGTGTESGIALTVKVVTGATGAGAIASSVAVTTPELAITPHGTGSWVYGALVNTFASGTFTAAGTTTFSENQYWSGDTYCFGTFRSTSTTTASTPVTIGASAPTQPATTLGIALCEILGSGLAEDASSPATAYTTIATTATTAAFSPPQGAVLVAMVSSDFSGTTSQSMTMGVTGGGLHWVLQATATFAVTGGTFQAATVWTAQVPSAGSGLLLIPPAPFSPMNFQRHALPSRAPLEAPSPDAGTGTEATSIAATVPGADTAAGTEGAFASPGAADADPGAGTETTSITGSLSSADTGTGTDAQTLTAITPGADTGTGTEAATASLGAASSESGTATDAGQLVIPSADTGTATDLGGGEGVLNFRGTPPFTVVRGAYAGTITLNGTTGVTVSTAGADAMSVIMLTVQPGTVPAGQPYVASVSPTNGFTVKSTSGADVGVVVAWWLVETA